MSGITLDLPWRGFSPGGAGCLIPVTEPEPEPAAGLL